MHQLLIFTGLLVVLLAFGSHLSKAQDSFFGQEKQEFTENGVPFVVEGPEESLEIPKPEASETAAQEQEAEDSKFTPVTDEETPVENEKIAVEKNITTSRPWKASDFSGQEGALGYEPQTFAVPPGLESNVKFWIDIYSKYTTDQGVLHDAENMDLIYEELDFTDISAQMDLSLVQKEKLKVKRVKEAKKRVSALLEKLQRTKDPSELTLQEKRIFDAFEKSQDNKKRFSDATKKNRLRFQLGQKDRVIQGIYFSGRYIEDFEKIFKEAGLPIELTRLPFVESSYNVLARSKVGASGLWQIMPYTMKGFMKRNPAVDLRNHPIEATKLAAKLLRINYNMLQSWPLALTGYNHGPSGVLRVTKKHKSRDIAELVARKRFGFASRNFYASFLAILEVTNNAPKYLGAVSWSKPFDSQDFKLPLAIQYRDLLRWFDGDDMKAQIFNPHITRLARTRGRPIPADIVVALPKGKLELAKKETDSSETLKKAHDAARAEGRIVTSVEVETQPLVHRARRGDTIQKLARDYGISVEDILTLNKWKKIIKLRRGQKVLIP